MMHASLNAANSSGVILLSKNSVSSSCLGCPITDR